MSVLACLSRHAIWLNTAQDRSVIVFLDEINIFLAVWGKHFVIPSSIGKLHFLLAPFLLRIQTNRVHFLIRKIILRLFSGELGFYSKWLQQCYKNSITKHSYEYSTTFVNYLSNNSWVQFNMVSQLLFKYNIFLLSKVHHTHNNHFEYDLTVLKYMNKCLRELVFS